MTFMAVPVEDAPQQSGEAKSNLPGLLARRRLRALRKASLEKPEAGRHDDASKKSGCRQLAGSGLAAME